MDFGNPPLDGKTIDLLSIHNYLSKRHQAQIQHQQEEVFASSTSMPDDFYFYLMRVLPLLEKFKDVQKRQRKIHFMSPPPSHVPDSTCEGDESSLSGSDALHTITTDFFKLLWEYFPDECRKNNWSQTPFQDEVLDTAKSHQTSLVSKTSRNGSKYGSGISSKARMMGSRLRCTECQNESDAFSIYDNYYVCEQCGLVSENTQNHISYKDIDRVNITSKYTYDRRTHFRDCINQFQGKQNASIDPKVYEDLCEQFLAHDLIPTNYMDLPKDVAFQKVTKEHIMIFLKDTKHTKHYEDVVLIYATLTLKPTPDISYLETQLIRDFDTLTEAYDKKYKHVHERKNFINIQYVLYQLLRRHKFPCRKEDFNILKTIDRKYYHDTLCAELFQQLGWNLHPLF